MLKLCPFIIWSLKENESGIPRDFETDKFYFQIKRRHTNAVLGTIKEIWNVQNMQKL